MLILFSIIFTFKLKFSSRRSHCGFFHFQSVLVKVSLHADVSHYWYRSLMENKTVRITKIYCLQTMESVHTYSLNFCHLYLSCIQHFFAAVDSLKVLSIHAIVWMFQFPSSVATEFKFVLIPIYHSFFGFENSTHILQNVQITTAAVKLENTFIWEEKRHFLNKRNGWRCLSEVWWNPPTYIANTARQKLLMSYFLTILVVASFVNLINLSVNVKMSIVKWVV